MVKNKLQILSLSFGFSLIMFSKPLLADQYKGGFCRVGRAASYDNKDNSNLSWLALECFNKEGQPVKGQTGLKQMNVPARWVVDGQQLKRTFPSYLIIDGQKVPNNGPDALDYFDTISGYGKTVENCKNKFPKLSCKNINFLLQPDHNIFEVPNHHTSDNNIPKSCKDRPAGMISALTFNCVEKAKDQFAGQDFVQDCSVEFCGRKGVTLKPVVVPTTADLEKEKAVKDEASKPVAEINHVNKNCVPNQKKYETFKNKMPMCLSGFHSNQSNARSMYETIAMYLSCSEFDFTSAEVVQEGKHLAAVGRNPANDLDCPIKLNIDVDANVGYGKIEFKDKSGKITSVDWDSKFDTTNSANNQPYWKSDFGRRLMATLNSNSSSGTGNLPAPSVNSNK